MKLFWIPHLGKENDENNFTCTVFSNDIITSHHDHSPMTVTICFAFINNNNNTITAVFAGEPGSVSYLSGTKPLPLMNVTSVQQWNRLLLAGFLSCWVSLSLHPVQWVNSFLTAHQHITSSATAVISAQLTVVTNTQTDRPRYIRNKRSTSMLSKAMHAMQPNNTLLQ